MPHWLNSVYITTHPACLGYIQISWILTSAHPIWRQCVGLHIIQKVFWLKVGMNSQDRDVICKWDDYVVVIIVALMNSLPWFYYYFRAVMTPQANHLNEKWTVHSYTVLWFSKGWSIFDPNFSVRETRKSFFKLELSY